MSAHTSARHAPLYKNHNTTQVCACVVTYTANTLRSLTTTSIILMLLLLYILTTIKVGTSSNVETK